MHKYPSLKRSLKYSHRIVSVTVFLQYAEKCCANLQKSGKAVVFFNQMCYNKEKMVKEKEDVEYISHLIATGRH